MGPDQRAGRAGSAARRWCSSMKRSRASATTSCPRGVRWTVSWKKRSGPGSACAQRRQQIQARQRQLRERRIEPLGGRVALQLTACRRDGLPQPAVVRVVDLEPRRHQRDRGSRASGRRRGGDVAHALSADRQSVRDSRRRMGCVALERRLRALRVPLKRSVAETTRSRSSWSTMLRRTRRRSRVATVSVTASDAGRASPSSRGADRTASSASLPTKIVSITRSGCSVAAMDLKNSSSSTGPYPCTPALMTR